MTGMFIVRMHQIIGPHQNLETPDLCVWRDQLPEEAVEAAHAHILGQPDRKEIYRPGDEMPRAIADIVLFAAPASNTKVAKRYVPGEDSGAFEGHFDDRKFEDLISLRDSSYNLITTGGLAITIVRQRQLNTRIREIYPLFIASRANTHIRAYGNPLHATTPPLTRETFDHFCATGELDMSLGGKPDTRTFVFGGTDVSLLDAVSFEQVLAYLTAASKLTNLMSVPEISISDVLGEAYKLP
jgi:hypothetical protein